MDTQIVEYLDHLKTDQKMAVQGVVKAFAQEQTEIGIWADDTFVKELDRRTTELENGTSKGYSWDEVKSITRQAISELRKI